MLITTSSLLKTFKKQDESDIDKIKKSKFYKKTYQ